jgi:hypothetical protein
VTRGYRLNPGKALVVDAAQSQVLNSPAQSITIGEFMQTASLNKKQSVELCDNIGKMLAMELDSAAVQNKVKRAIADYVKANMLADNAEDIMRKMSWSVKVELKK